MDLAPSIPIGAASSSQSLAEESGGRTYSTRASLWILCGVLAFIGLFTPNGLITSVSCAVVPILVLLLWRNGEPPVLLFGCALQWIQATAAIFYTNYYGMTLEEAFGGESVVMATWLSILAIVVLALGVRCALIRAGESKSVELEADASKIDVHKLAILYGISFVVSGAADAVAWHLPSITQLLLAVGSLKWAVVFLLCYTVLHQRRGYGVLLTCIGLEFASGLFGIFSSFKSVFLVFVVASLSSRMGLRGRRLAATSACAVLLFVMGVVWTAVKMDYREFLAAGASGDDDVIPIERKFEKLADLVSGVTWDNFTDGMEAMVLRLSYVNYFALSIDNVPAQIPYENGDLWKGSVLHVVTPRLFFPDKPALDDSERTRYYTGVQVAGSEAGTSIGIGYVGESYIDFGPVWMFVPIFLLGILYGLISRVFIVRARYKLIGSALAVSMLVFNAYAIETSNIKLVGGIITVTLVGGVLYWWFGGLIARAMAARREAPASRQFYAMEPIA